MMICLIPPLIRGLTYLYRLPTCLGPPPKKAKVSTQKASPKKASVRKTRGASNQKDDPVPAKVVAEKSKGPKKGSVLKTKAASKRKVVEKEDVPVPAKAVTAKPKGQKKGLVSKTKAVPAKAVTAKPQGQKKDSVSKTKASSKSKSKPPSDSSQLKSPPEDAALQDIQDVPSETVNSAPEKGQPTKAQTKSDSEDFDTDEEESLTEFTPTELDCHYSKLEVVKCHERNDTRTPIVRLCMFCCLFVLHVHFPLTLFTFIRFNYITAALPPIFGWVCACLQMHAGEAISRCLSYGSQSRPFLCGHVSSRQLARYEQAWHLNAKLYLRHHTHPSVPRNHDSVMSVISGTFPTPEWDTKKMLITKTQKYQDKFFIQAMATSFVLCSIMPSAERQKPPTDPKELVEYEAQSVILDQRCDLAADCIFRICKDLSERLTQLRHDSHIYDHECFPVQKGHYLHYVRSMSEIKAKGGKSGGVVVSWPALLEGKRPRMFLPHFLVLREFVHFTPHLSDQASALLSHVVDDNNNVIYDDKPASISIVRQMIEDAGNHGEQWPST